MGLVIRFQDLGGPKEQELVLEQARRSAESADRAKSLFLANTSHELRTPPTAILGHSQLLREGDAESTASDHSEVIQRNGRHLLALINQ